MSWRLVTVALAWWVGACARDVPTQFPADSAAAPEGPEAPPAVVTRALQEDPPLPGEAREGWKGLGDPTPPAMEHRHAH